MGAHSSVITLLEDITKSLSDAYGFGYGAASEFNSIQNKKYPYVWLDPLRGGFPNKDQVVSDLIDWEVSLTFLVEDAKLGNERETALAWDKAFKIMEDFIHKLDREFLNSDDEDRIQSDNITLSGINFTSRRKGTTDILSGWNLTFTMQTPSDFDYCSIYG